MAKTYYVSRLSINGKYNIQSDGFKIKESIIDKTLINNQIEPCYDSSNKHVYKFVNILKFHYSDLDDIVYHGILSRSNKVIESISDDGGNLINEQTDKFIVQGKVEFFLILKSGILIYTPLKDFNKESFNNIFSKLFKHNAPNDMYDLSVGTINKSNSIIENLKQLKIVQTIEINLLPSNPDFSDAWKEEDDEIKRINANSVKHIYKSKKEGGISVGNTVEALKETRCGKQLLMAEDGYGQVVCKGIDNNDKKATVKNNKYQEYILNIPNDHITNENSANNKFKWIYNNGLTRILNRFIHHEEDN